MSCKKAKGIRAKTRHKFKRGKEKTTVNKLLQELEVGAKVHIDIDSSIHSGMPFRRYQGSTGVVTGRRGAIFKVEVGKGSSARTLLVHPGHLNVSQEKAKGR